MCQKKRADRQVLADVSKEECSGDISGLAQSGDYFSVKFFAVSGADHFSLDQGNRRFFAVTADFKALLSLDVQIRIGLLQLFEYLSRALVVFAETYLHLPLRLQRRYILIQLYLNQYHKCFLQTLIQCYSRVTSCSYRGFISLFHCSNITLWDNFLSNRFSGVAMKVHFIRHAQAIERSAELPDEYRNLTCRGRKRFRQVAACLKKMDIDPDFIITSPKVRAVQTAEILAETLRFSGEVRISADLATGPDISALGNLLGSKNESREIVIVGHEPGLGEAVGELLKLSTPCSLTKGSVVTLKISSKQSGLTAELTGVITGGGKMIRKAGAAMERLQGENQ